MREQFPEGFEWTCCNLSGESQGCRSGRHQADPSKSKKGLDVESELDDEIESELNDDEESDEDRDEEETDDKTHEGNRDNGDESEYLRYNKRQKREI
jgi:hypothetical protein